MPITTTGVTGILLPSLLSTGFLGTDLPKLSRGVASGVVRWANLVKVSTVDAGSAGTGSGQIPVLVPYPLLFGNITAGFASNQLIGIFAPLFITGLTNGLVNSFLQGLVKTTHAGVGTGAGVASFRGPPAQASLSAGFRSAGMNGDATDRLARALGQALDRTFASLVIPVPIVGTASPSAATGKGSGKII